MINMTNSIKRIFLPFLIGLSSVIMNGCDKNDDATIPDVSTSNISSITAITAKSGGNISSDGGSAITERGVCWSTVKEPTIHDNKATDGSTGTGSFNTNIFGLEGNTVYYVRAYATNASGTSYGDELSFTTHDGFNFQVGDKVQGGIVFYVDGTGHGLICTPTTLGAFVWGCVGLTASSSGTAVGKGASNTAAILNTCNDAMAAMACDNLVLEGYNDWFLPSKDELALIYAHVVITGLGNFSSGYYWSSSESDAQYAWNFNFTDGSTGINHKTNEHLVCAARAF